MNAFAERWVLSVKSECLNQMILFGEASLRRSLREYGAHLKDASYYLIILVDPEVPGTRGGAAWIYPASVDW